jgi:cold shock CspA family protein
VVDVFVSYARTDRERAEAVVQGLQRQDWSVWWDRKALPGDEVSTAVDQTIDLALAGVVLWSKTSATRRWVLNEAEACAQRKIIVPARLDDVRLPLPFRTLQTADLSDWVPTRTHAGFQSLLAALANRVQKPVIDPGPEPSAEQFCQDGLAYEQRGMLSEARRAYIRALSVDSDNRVALSRLLALTMTSRAPVSQIALGTIKWFNAQKGYGFIIPEDDSEGIVFLHISAVEGNPKNRAIESGDRVAYLPVSRQGRTAASRVRVL